MDTGNFTGFELSLREPGIAWFQFNTPERLNGMTTAIKRDLIEATTQAQMDNAVRVLVFTGSGRAFCAGDDLKAYRSAELGGTPLVPTIPPGHDSGIGTYNGLRTISQRVNSTIRNIDKLTIAAINGVAIQTGFSLALSCDFRIASSSARMGSATLRFGLLPDEGGQYLLVQLLGLSKALDFLMRKKIVSAEEALSLGLVNEVVPLADLMPTALKWAETICKNGPLAVRTAKEIAVRSLALEQGFVLEKALGERVMSSEDAKEGPRAFAEKRPPKFTGR
ncbi:MAG: enoyl-CoA hydratase/isomerase family protein [Proteobacteria bacterium]|nr:enoyl-CoA hydratase/isomerase family protein [Pseudomonadota bacterium]